MEICLISKVTYKYKTKMKAKNINKITKRIFAIKEKMQKLNKIKEEILDNKDYPQFKIYRINQIQAVLMRELPLFMKICKKLINKNSKSLKIK